MFVCWKTFKNKGICKLICNGKETAFLFGNELLLLYPDITVRIQLQMHLGVFRWLSQTGHKWGKKIEEEDISAEFSQRQEIPLSSNVFWLQSWLLVKPMTVNRWVISGRDLDPGPGPLVVKIRVARLKQHTLFNQRRATVRITER